jgi:two-component system phosphate regulon sensor histidine kinase PhoR
MLGNDDCIEDTVSPGSLRAPRTATQFFTWSSERTMETLPFSDYGATLLAIAGHDLRQPLQVIKSAHELMGLGLRTQSELRWLQSGERAIVRLTAQLDQLLAALRLHEPEGVKPAPLQLAHVLQQVAYENELEALKKGIKLRVVPSRLSILSDGLLFSAILRNLVRNAIKYTDPGGRILVGCRCAGDAVRIEIHDTGIGISSEQVPRIFDLFACMGNRSGDSHGVGLYIVRQATGILGHRLEITTAPAQGSCFCVVAKKV